MTFPLEAYLTTILETSSDKARQEKASRHHAIAIEHEPSETPT